MLKVATDQFDYANLPSWVHRQIQNIKICQGADVRYPFSLRYVYEHEGFKLTNQINYKQRNTTQPPQFLILSAQIPPQIVKLYQQIWQSNHRNKKINFKQGFIKSWGYLYYSIEKTMYLINPCKNLFPELFHHT